MFTGIVEEIGQIAAIRKGSASAVLSIQASKVLEGTKIGDSIAVNGICLTVTGMQERSFTADVMAETLRRSSLGVLGKGAAVNLDNDSVGKYVERFLTFEKPAETSCQSVDLAFLAEHGFA